MEQTSLLSDSLLFKLRRFVFSSGIATSLHWTVLWLLISQSVDAVVANGIGAFFGAVANYFLQFHLTFQRRARHAVASANYIASCALGWLANSLLFALFVQVLGMPVLLAQCLVLGIVAGFNFVLYQYWVFNER